MKICFPTETLQGLESDVFGHFGSAPGFIIVETDSMGVEEIQNVDQHHVHGMCQPMKALGGRKVEGVVVGGIGMGALMKLQAEGVRVYRGFQGTVRENLEMIKSGKLPVFTAEHTCGGGESGCAHH